MDSARLNSQESKNQGPDGPGLGSQLVKVINKGCSQLSGLQVFYTNLDSENINIVIGNICKLNANQYLIGGDLSFPKINRTNNSADESLDVNSSSSGSSSVETEFYETCQDCFLHQHLTKLSR